MMINSIGLYQKMRINEKICLLLFLIIFILTSNPLGIFTLKGDCSKNVPRVVLVELFVQESCSTCPTAEFCLEDLAWEYGTGKLILVEEHLWGDGYDIPETNARYNWYVGKTKKGTPDVFINGLTKRIQGLACDCVDENYACYKEIIDEVLTRLSLIELSASKSISDYIEDTPHLDLLPQGERETERENKQEEEEKEELNLGKKSLNMIIEGKVKNVSDIPLKDLAVCGMIYKERDMTGLYCCVQDIFSFQSIPLFFPGDSFNFRFVSELLVDQESNEENLHNIVFVQNLETKEVLQAFYVN